MEDLEKSVSQKNVNFKCKYFLCDFQIRLLTEGVDIFFRSAKWAYLLETHTPSMLDVSQIFQKGVCGIQKEQPIIVYTALSIND